MQGHSDKPFQRKLREWYCYLLVSAAFLRELNGALEKWESSLHPTHWQFQILDRGRVDALTASVGRVFKAAVSLDLDELLSAPL